MKNKIHWILGLILVAPLFINAQDEIKEKQSKFPSYFGLQVRPVFPTKFIGNSVSTIQESGFSTQITQKMGYSFGGTIRAGITKLIAFESGINYTERHFDILMNIIDSNVVGKNDLTFVEYDIPLNGLFYIQLSDQFYMNASMGVLLTYKPSNVGVLTQPGGPHTFTHTGFVKRKTGLDLNANIGFEFRTEQNGFFYFGGSARVPFAPLFYLLGQYKYHGIEINTNGPVDGSFLALDLKYFFPNIRNKGTQFKPGPIL